MGILVSHPQRYAALARTLALCHAALDRSVASALAKMSESVGLVACRRLRIRPVAEDMALLGVVVQALSDLRRVIAEELIGVPPLPETERQIAALIRRIADLSEIYAQMTGRGA
jgi:hypothetical protein